MDPLGFAVLQFFLALALAPLLPGVINRTKAVVAGRRGQPLLQAYYDIAKLLQKGAVYSRTTSVLFTAGPLVSLAAVVAASAFLPWAGGAPLLSFGGDILLFAGLLGLARFMTILAALDTGSAFEGMGASREAWFSALAEPALLLGLAGLARPAGSVSLAGILACPALWTGAGAALLLTAGAVFVVFLAENSRIPVDDPTTHLELTMIHEVMVLDHGGVELAAVQYGASVKLWTLGGLFVCLLVPRTGLWAADVGIGLAGMAVTGIVTGLVESVMARLPMGRVPQLLVAAIAMSGLGFALALVR
jgi:formate hydrogenlyase subunit 4